MRAANPWYHARLADNKVYFCLCRDYDMCYNSFRGSDEMTFAEALKDARLKLGLSQTELAREIHVSFTTINRYENGHHK